MIKKTLKLLTIIASFQTLVCMEQRQICSGNNWLEYEQNRVKRSFATTATQTDLSLNELSFLDFIEKESTLHPDKAIPLGQLRLLWRYESLQSALTRLGMQSTEITDYFNYNHPEESPERERQRVLLNLIVMQHYQLEKLWPEKKHTLPCDKAFLKELEPKLAQIEKDISFYQEALKE